MVLALVLCLLLLPLLLQRILPRVSSSVRPYLGSAPSLASFLIILLTIWPQMREGKTVAFSFDWVPTMGISFDLSLTGWGLLLSLLVTGIGFLIMLYTFGYEADVKKQMRLYSFLSLFMFAMVGITFSDHLIMLFIFWELTSIVSYLLVGFYHEKEESRKNALQALLITGSGGICLLGGLILLNIAGGSWNISLLTENSEAIKQSPLYPALFTLIGIGALTKSAQFPFHFWLPNAMVAPTPISAYLHSATMVKAGVFLLGVFSPILGGTPLWINTFTTLGLITLFIGGIFGLKQHDLKAILAGTTIAVLGILVFLLGLGTEKALLALSIFIVGHALYKACLFMVAGIVDKATGCRDTRVLSGIRHAMPFTAAIAMVAAISKMGLPPFYGFIGKEYVYKAIYPYENELLNWVLILGNAIVLALAVKTAIFPFFKGKKSSIKDTKPMSALILFSPALLAILGLVLGLLPSLITPITNVAVESLTNQSQEVKVLLWSGFNKPLLMSFETLVTGILIVFGLGLFYKLINNKVFSKASPNATYENIYNLLLGTAKWFTQFFQSGYLRNYLAIIIIATLSLVAWKLSQSNVGTNVDFILPFNPIIVMVSLLMIVSVIVAVTTQSKLTAIIALGVIGFGAALYFAIYSAPDLAITQLLVETLTVVIFSWVIKKIGAFHEYSKVKTRLFDGLIALLAGVTVTSLVLKSKALQLSRPISDEMTTLSYPEGKGSNVVNVILVDFRALDTLGEITVLAIAAIGVWALLTQMKNFVKSKSST